MKCLKTYWVDIPRHIALITFGRLSWKVTMKVLRFNQDASSCVVSNSGNELSVYNCDPFGKVFEFDLREDMNGSTDGIQYDSLGAGSSDDTPVIVEMLFSTSLLAVVSSQDLNDRKKLKIVNTKKKSVICELLHPADIVNVVMNRKRICVLLDNDQIFIYDISCMKLIETLDLWEEFNSGRNQSNVKVGERASTMINENLNNGSVNSTQGSSINNSTISNSSDGRQRAYSLGGIHKVKSQITLSGDDKSVLCYSTYSVNNHKGSHYMLNDIVVYDALNLKPLNYLNSVHKGNVICMHISNDGKLLATASEKGTIVRINKTGVDYDFSAGPSLYKEFRRGTRPSHLHQLLFNKDASYLACVGSSDTIHIFKMDDDSALLESIELDAGSDSGSSLDALKNRIPHGQFKSFLSKNIKSRIPNQNLHRDYAHINMDKIVHCIAGFPEEFNNKVYIATNEGSFKTYTLPSKRGLCVLNKTSQFK